MALSKSLQSGQAPLSCQMCEESNEIKWKCLLCDFLLCTKCQTLHKKVKSTNQHTIIDIKDIAFHQIQTKDTVDLSEIPCGVHKGQNCCLFCDTCEEVICPSCILTAHNKHNMIGLSEGYKMTVKAIKVFHTEVGENILQTEKGISKLCLTASSGTTKYGSERQKILNRDRVLKIEVEKHTQNLLTELDQYRDFLSKSVHDEENRSQEIKNNLESRKESLSKPLYQNNANEVFSIFKKERALRADKKEQIEQVNTNFKALPQYVPGKQSILLSQHGELTEVEDDHEQDKFEFQVIQQFKTKLSIVENLVCGENGTLWINHCFAKKIQNIQLQKGSVPVQVIKKLKAFSFNMALLPTGDLLISSKTDALQILSKITGEIKQSTYSFSPLQTIAVYVTKANQIIVGLREKGEPYPVRGPRQVIVMDMAGRKEKVYHLDNTGKSIFTVPSRIVSDKENYLYVIDWTNLSFRGRIVSLNKTNGVRWVYSGNQQILKPRDLVMTKLNNIIVSDSDHHMIHILNTSGHCMHYLNTKDKLGIHCPYSLDIDNTGTLYIGCARYKSEPDEAKIYTVKVSGF